MIGLGVSLCSNLFVNHVARIPSLSCVPSYLYHPYMQNRRIFNLLVQINLDIFDVPFH